MNTRLQRLGDRLDQAERDADEAQARGDGSAHHDYETPDGVLHHDPLTCWDCRMRAAASDYRAAARQAAINHRTTIPRKTSTLWRRFAAAEIELKDAREFYEGSCDLGASERMRINAAVALEIADTDFVAIRLELLNRRRFARAAGPEAVRHFFAGARLKTKHHTVVDGYVKTGRTKLVDGVRVPIVKRVRSPST